MIERVDDRPRIVERDWGHYEVVDHLRFEDGFRSLTKLLVLRPGAAISYQLHRHRDELWQVIDGEGLFLLDGVSRTLRRGDIAVISRLQRHSVRALSRLVILEVQTGLILDESDIERFPLPGEKEIKN